MASATGTATIDFGAAPGVNETFTDVIDQTEITSAAMVEAFFMADDSTIHHTNKDHRYAPTFISLTCGTPTDGVGFTIYARSHHQMTGRWSVRWVWAT